SSPFHPTVQGTRPNPGWSALQAIEHGGYVYTTYMSGGISREPAATFGSGLQTFYATRFQANALCPDPNPPLDNGFYLADGRGGVHRINIP
ncbi:MAG: hypothetical protein HY812_11520, partial [Planctomycetes bacterium]|nr:hypothetical protein [Planctomycetota bacterium]MBI4880269.1 hypothetical protein [Planctomycetota bacterium]